MQQASVTGTLEPILTPQVHAMLQEDRQWALRRGLEEINLEIEAASRAGVASCWFPMGSRHERIIRLAAKEASLLNSR